MSERVFDFLAGYLAINTLQGIFNAGKLFLLLRKIPQWGILQWICLDQEISTF
jgi:hypothetical protein